MARGALADNLTALAALAEKGVVSGAVARERTLPVLAPFVDLLPHGALQRGSVVGCHGVAGVSLAIALAAGPSAEGAWVGVAGLPGLGVAAAVELGVAADRLVLVNEPTGSGADGTRFDDARWAEVLAAMIDGFDVLVLGPGTERVRAGTARRLMARLQARGAVAIVVGAPDAGPFGTDLTLQADSSQWQGLGDGHGVARGRRSVVQVAGRRVPRPRRAPLWLPGADGCIATIEQSHGTVVPLRPTG
ncbi:unannotated protein [freshwater metagenome]|uniref:Unannotated protein n=1 Tax=freshwater metagenome TaxID=449393 RepID=A0A6J7C679_9ZZZZ